MFLFVLNHAYYLQIVLELLFIYRYIGFRR